MTVTEGCNEGDNVELSLQHEPLLQTVLAAFHSKLLLHADVNFIQQIYLQIK